MGHSAGPKQLHRPSSSHRGDSDRRPGGTDLSTPHTLDEVLQLTVARATLMFDPVEVDRRPKVPCHIVQDRDRRRNRGCLTMRRLDTRTNREGTTTICKLTGYRPDLLLRDTRGRSRTSDIDPIEEGGRSARTSKPGIDDRTCHRERNEVIGAWQDREPLKIGRASYRKSE